MEPQILLSLTVGLIAWAFFSLGAAVVGLYFPPKKDCECWRAFWFMNGIWGLIDGIIGWANLISAPPTIEFLQKVLAINSGLDLLYIITGLVLLTRAKPVLKGFGFAILLQGLFLLIFDAIFLFLCYRS
ncbi:MAG: hypothetical protein EXS07_13950 [Gemmataceae bacterium]|nr:hypothetical protein [Gemmataceae bacterium]